MTFPPGIHPEEAARLVQDAALPNLWLPQNEADSLAYNDGDGVEERMLASMFALQPGSDVDVACETLVQDWPSQYHCDPARRNLLHPVTHLLRGRVLEVGAGCGALTGFIAAHAAEVLALEGATRRARITAARHRGRHNVTVIACDFGSFRPAALFDTIVVVGVLEYSPTFGPGGLGAPKAFLEQIHAVLAPGGTMLLAIENQLGLSYISGMPEDHAGRPWVGVEDRYGTAAFRTFGRQALETLLRRAGFGGQSWYYPFPDYKLPTTILAEAALQTCELDIGELVAQVTRDQRFRPDGPGFTPALAWTVASENGLLGHLADSFLVAAALDSDPPCSQGGLAWVFATRRQPAFRKVSRIGWEEGALHVRRWSLHPDAAGEEGSVRQVLEAEAYTPGASYLAALRRLCACGIPDAATLANWAMEWVTFLRAHAAPDGTLPSAFLDCIPANLICTPAGELVFFDREWHATEPLPLDHVVFRGLMDAVSRMSAVLPAGSAGPLRLTVMAEAAQILGVVPDISASCGTEAALQAAVSGENPFRIVAAMHAARLQGPEKTTEDPVHLLQAADEQMRGAHAITSAAYLRGLLGDGSDLVGYIDGVARDPKGIRIVRGWARDQGRNTGADLVVLFVGGHAVASAPVCMFRPDLMQMGGDGLYGFSIVVPDGCGPVTRQSAVAVVWSSGRMGLLAWAVGATEG